MITKIELQNFKNFEDISLDLSQVTVLVGPNNSGKTTILQALTLWDIALRKWITKKTSSKAKERTGVTINRQDLFAIPVPEAKLLWHDLHVRSGVGENSTIFLTISLEGITDHKAWKAGLQFYYGNPESFYVKPVDEQGDFQNFELALKESVAYLPPMSGLAAVEERLEEGSIRRRIGEGRTAEVLRNLLWKIYDSTDKTAWDDLCKVVKNEFLTELLPPHYHSATSLITCRIKEKHHPEMDITASGRGFQQFVLLYSYLYYQKHTILLLDEPDAHLEIIRQKSLYDALIDHCKKNNNQLIIATHSEAILDISAKNEDLILAFVGIPHRAQKLENLKKALSEIPASDYILAIEKQSVLYVEGTADLALLKAFAMVLQHPVEEKLRLSFVVYLNTNDLSYCQRHFSALKEAIPDLKGVLLTDRLTYKPGMPQGLTHLEWKRNEIECYLPLPSVLYRYFSDNTEQKGELFISETLNELQQIVTQETAPAALSDPNHEFWKEEKISDKWLSPILRKYYQAIGYPMEVRKSDFYRLAELAQPEELDPEIKEKLDILEQLL
jgi:predicted ATPase